MKTRYIEPQELRFKFLGHGVKKIESPLFKSNFKKKFS